MAWPWIKNSAVKFFKSPLRTRVNFFLNTVLFILAITEIVSGFFISQVVLPYLKINTILDTSWRSAHNLPLNFTVLFFGLHIAVNWKWIVSVFKKQLSAPKHGNRSFSRNPMTTILRIIILICATAVVAFALYRIVGNPSLDRLYNQDEIARFTPTFGHGVVQFLGEASLVALYAFVAHKWLQVKL